MGLVGLNKMSVEKDNSIIYILYEQQNVVLKAIGSKNYYNSNSIDFASINLSRVNYLKQTKPILLLKVVISSQ